MFITSSVLHLCPLFFFSLLLCTIIWNRCQEEKLRTYRSLTIQRSYSRLETCWCLLVIQLLHQGVRRHWYRQLKEVRQLHTAERREDMCSPYSGWLFLFTASMISCSRVGVPIGVEWLFFASFLVIGYAVKEAAGGLAPQGTWSRHRTYLSLVKIAPFTIREWVKHGALRWSWIHMVSY